MYRSHVLVCGGTGCTSSGSQAIINALESEIKKNGLETEVQVVKTGCFGLCALGPIMIVYPEGTFYSMVKEEDIPALAASAYADACRPGNPRETSEAEIAELYKSLM